MCADFKKHLRNTIDTFKKIAVNTPETREGVFHLIGNIDGLLTLISDMDDMHDYKLELQRLSNEVYKAL